MPEPEPNAAKNLLADVRGRLDRLQGKRDELVTRQNDLNLRLNKINTYLAIADSVTDALEQLSNDVFQKELTVIESTLTKALQEVLDQPVVFKATASFKRDAASVEFSIERDGNPEDIMRGQGGSVANVVSVGLRMFAITTLDDRRHRKFLVLDEQDCWLHPDLVPRLVRIVHEAGTALGFQVLMISHHDVSNFLRHADRVYRLTPDRGDGVGLELVRNDADVMVSDE
ncbi:MAG TPA: DNA repair protein [Planctomycetes bacterium]|nr:DNA repair protein [Fuerstiella sp.]HIK90505.1 DNA repair protein [Planctomycetota bacterium]